MGSQRVGHIQTMAGLKDQEIHDLKAQYVFIVLVNYNKLIDLIMRTNNNATEKNTALLVAQFHYKLSLNE